MSYGYSHVKDWMSYQDIMIYFIGIMKKQTKSHLWILLIVCLVVILSVFIVKRSKTNQIVTNFESCAKAGYKLSNVNPSQCHTPDGRVFNQTISMLTSTPALHMNVSEPEKFQETLYVKERFATIQIDQTGFHPQELRINVGTVVIWKNLSGSVASIYPDNYRADTLELNPETITNGSSLTHTFNTLGVYTYYNYYHPDEKGMIIVENKPLKKKPSSLEEAVRMEIIDQKVIDDIRSNNEADTIITVGYNGSAADENEALTKSFNSRKEDVLRAGGSGIKLLNDYDMLPIMHLKIYTLSALLDVARADDIIRINKNSKMQLF